MYRDVFVLLAIGLALALAHVLDVAHGLYFRWLMQSLSPVGSSVLAAHASPALIAVLDVWRCDFPILPVAVVLGLLAGALLPKVYSFLMVLLPLTFSAAVSIQITQLAAEAKIFERYSLLDLYLGQFALGPAYLAARNLSLYARERRLPRISIKSWLIVCAAIAGMLVGGMQRQPWLIAAMSLAIVSIVAVATRYRPAMPSPRSPRPPR